jgi:serine/threonine-protein kinase
VLIKVALVSSTNDEPALGERVGTYQLEEVLGQGGMGQVFRGRHHLLGRAVAVKILSPQLAADQEFVSRFFYEARVVNEIRHPNIIDIIDFIEIDQPRRVAYVMELLDGISLGALLKTRRLSALQAINACLQLSDALEAVHRLNVIHRDLKPDNVFVVQPLDSDLATIPSLKVIDFGIAKTLDAGGAQGHRTSTGAVLGTPAYMAPEQIDGVAVGPAVDIYALGEILYEMVSGVRMFSGSNTAVFAAKVVGPPQLSLPAGLPGAAPLQALIERCVAIAPELRPSIEEVRAGLNEALELQPPLPEEPSPARRSSSSGRAATPSRSATLQRPLDTFDGRTMTPSPRSSLPLGLLGGGALLLAAGAAWLMLRAGPASVEQLPVVVAPQAQPAEAPRAPSPVATPSPVEAPEPAPIVSPAQASATPSPSPSAKGKPRAKPGPLKRDEVTEW